MAHRWSESRVGRTQACQRIQLNLLLMLSVDTCSTPHRRLADGLAAWKFHLCLSGTFDRWALNRKFQNETKPVLKTAKVTPHVHLLGRKNLAHARQHSNGRLSRNDWVVSCPKDPYGSSASGRLWQVKGEMELRIVHGMNKAAFENC